MFHLHSSLKYYPYPLLVDMRKSFYTLSGVVMKDLVFFHYDKGSHAQKIVIELLHNYRDVVQKDGYEAYSIYENKKGVLLFSRWAHARRKFNEALKEDNAGAEYALEQIGLIHGVESMAEDQKLD